MWENVKSKVHKINVVIISITTAANNEFLIIIFTTEYVLCVGTHVTERLYDSDPAKF